MKGKKRMAYSSKQAAPKQMYFGPEVQDSMMKYRSREDSKEKEKIYVEEIMPAFNKLVENLIYIYGFAKGADSVHEVKSDCVCFLYENMHKFDPSRGTKAFSYFNVVARNWLIIHSKKRVKDGVRSVSIEDVTRLSQVDRRTIANHSIMLSPDDILINAGRKDRILEVLTKIDNRLSEEYEKSAMSALRMIFENADDIDLLSKRAVFLYVREIANLNQKQLSAAMAVIRRHYKDISSEMGGII
jgi:hypothetical protein